MTRDIFLSHLFVCAKREKNTETKKIENQIKFIQKKPEFKILLSICIFLFWNILNRQRKIEINSTTKKKVIHQKSRNKNKTKKRCFCIFRMSFWCLNKATTKYMYIQHMCIEIYDIYYSCVSLFFGVIFVGSVVVLSTHKSRVCHTLFAHIYSF